MKKLLTVVTLASMGIFLIPCLSEGRTIRVPAEYPTIEAGINAASSGDTVLVAAGTYHENNIRMKAGVVIKGDGIDLSIVDGDGETVFWGADDATLEGFTITNASGRSEDGIFAWSTTPTISNNKITNCYSAISVADNAVIKNNIIYNNSDYGIFCGTNSSPLITHNLIVESDGAIVSVSADLIAFNNSIHKNNRGLWIQKSSSDPTPVVVTATNNIFSSNSWYGVYLSSSSTSGVDPTYMTITYNDVWNNSPNYSSNWSPDPSDISQDPLFVNPGLSKRSLKRLSVFEIAKVIEKDEMYNTIKTTQNEEFRKSGTKKLNGKNIVVKNEFMPLVQIDPSDYYLQEGSPCIDAGDPNSPLDTDGTRVDMGAFYYNQSKEVDAQMTTVVANPDSIPADGVSTSTITVTPKDALDNNLGTGQNVVLASTAGTLLDIVSDNGDGTYTQELQSSTTPVTAIITATVNGVEMNQKPQIVFISTVGIEVRIDPPQVNRAVGDTFTVNVVIESVTNLGSFQFEIEYGTSMVHADDAWLGSFLSSTGRSASPVGPTIDNTSDPGKVTFGGFTIGTASGPAGSGVLAIVRFTAQDSGSTILDLKNIQVTDINGQVQSIAVIGDGHVTVGLSNHSPAVMNTIPDTTLVVGDSDFQRDLNATPAVFNDPDGDELSYVASSAATSVARAAISGSVLTVSPLSEGSAVISVTADDGRGGHASMTFIVRVGVLNPPENLTATSHNSETVVLNWAPPSSTSFFALQQYRIYCSKQPDPLHNVDEMYTNDANTTSFTHAHLTYKDEWYYAVTALYTGARESPPCSELKVVVNVENTIFNVPTEFALMQNYPNPFNPETTIEYKIPKRSKVTINIYNLRGQEILTFVDQEKEPGYYKISWNGKDSFGKQVASGIYVYEMRAGNFVMSKKVAFIR